MDLYENAFDAEEIVAGIAEWAAIESPSFDAAAVNQMMNLAQSAMVRLGATVERMPGAKGFGDVVCARFRWGEGPGILVLGHLTTNFLQ